MEINKNSIQNLYRGLGHEYYTASLLWQMGLEAYKMDADFGFDIFAFNQREKIFNKLPEKKYFIQVKSRILTNFNSRNFDGAGIRNESETNIFIKSEDLERLLSDDNAVLVCHLTNENREYLATFWIDHENLKLLNTYKFFYEETEIENYKSLKIQYKSKPDPKEHIKNKLDNLLNQTNCKELKAIQDELKEIKEWIDKSSLINENAKTNIYFYSSHKDLNSKFYINEFYSNFENLLNDKRPNLFPGKDLGEIIKNKKRQKNKTQCK